MMSAPTSTDVFIIIGAYAWCLYAFIRHAMKQNPPK